VTRLRLLVLIASAGTLLVGLPGPAGARVPGSAPSRPSVGEPRALQLLGAAARAARHRSYSGTQYISTWRDGTATSHVADVRHSPTTGSVVTVRPTAGGDGDDAPVTLSTDLDLRLLRLLSDHYELDVSADGTCTGRTAHVVEARRRAVTGDGAVAGRFWVDADSALVLRREVFDLAGRLVRSSAFAALTVDAAVAAQTAVPAAAPGRLRDDELERLRRSGWHIAHRLPGDLELFDARVRTHDGKDVLHLSYSDGLSTLSLFAQRGRLGTEPMAGFAKQKVGAAAVWVRSSTPQRVVWGGGGRVFTLLSDAPPDAVREVVSSLPHDRAPKSGLLARLGRGLARLASWLNPFG
jgi:sigma-E factor negative regulatory protein RseB